MAARFRLVNYYNLPRNQVGMLLFNKLAIQHFPLECSLVWAQLFFSAACLSLFAFPYIHVGSMKDLLRWCMVVPFYCGTWLSCG